MTVSLPTCQRTRSWYRPVGAITPSKKPSVLPACSGQALAPATACTEAAPGRKARTTLSPEAIS